MIKGNISKKETKELQKDVQKKIEDWNALEKWRDMEEKNELKKTQHMRKMIEDFVRFMLSFY